MHGMLVTLSIVLGQYYLRLNVRKYLLVVSLGLKLVQRASWPYVVITWSCISRAVARALIGGGGCIFIYSGSARLVSFEMKLI